MAREGHLWAILTSAVEVGAAVAGGSHLARSMEDLANEVGDGSERRLRFVLEELYWSGAQVDVWRKSTVRQAVESVRSGVVEERKKSTVGKYI